MLYKYTFLGISYVAFKRKESSVFEEIILFQGCFTTAASPGDDVDNDCDGLIDEDDCTRADLSKCLFGIIISS